MNSLEILKLNKSRMNFMVEKLYDSNKDIKVAIHKNESIYSIDENKNVFKVISETKKSPVGSEEILDTLNSKQLVNLFDNKYKLIIPNKLSNTLTCVAANCLTTEKIGNRNVSNISDNSETKFELNNKTDEFVSVALDQSSKIIAAGYKIFEDSVKSLGEKIIDVLQLIVNPNINTNVSNSVTGSSSSNELKTAVKGIIEDKTIKKNTKITDCTNRVLFKIGDMLISTQSVGLKYTSDGENWSDVEGEIDSKSIKFLFKFSDKIIAWATDNSFYYSSNGINWTKISNSYFDSSSVIDDIIILKDTVYFIINNSIFYINNNCNSVYNNSKANSNMLKNIHKVSDKYIAYNSIGYFDDSYTYGAWGGYGYGNGTGGSGIAIGNKPIKIVTIGG